MSYDNDLESPYQEQMRTDDRFERYFLNHRDTLLIEYLQDKGLDELDSEKEFRQWCALNWEDDGDD